jgi:hypothetical protein
LDPDYWYIRENFQYFINFVIQELIRAEREKRTEPEWKFCQYFLLQEQLAFVYEVMGLQVSSFLS